MASSAAENKNLLVSRRNSTFEDDVLCVDGDLPSAQRSRFGGGRPVDVVDESHLHLLATLHIPIHRLGLEGQLRLSAKSSGKQLGAPSLVLGSGDTLQVRFAVRPLL